MATRNSSSKPGSDRAVLYLRMSSERQETSIEDQRHELTKYAAQHGYGIVKEYADAAISGDRTEQRTGFLAMRDAAGRGEFDVILCWDQDRFGRFDPLDAGYWIYPFRRVAVRLETVGQGKIDWEDLTGQLIYSVNQLGKAQFLRDLARNTTRGQVSSARSGDSGTGGRAPYGYRQDDGKVRVVEAEAEVVRWIFAEYLKPGSGLRSIADELNRRGTPPPGGSSSKCGKWRNSTIRTILKRRKYTGSFVYGCRTVGRYFGIRDGEITPRRKTDGTERSSAPIVHRDRFEAIIDQDTFDQVQARLAVRKRNTAPRQARQYLLSGLCVCGDCNSRMQGIRPADPGYCCHLYHTGGGSSCWHNTIQEAPLVECIVRKIKERYLSEAALARLRKALEAEQTRDEPKTRDAARLRREIEILDRKIDNAEEAVLDAPQNSRAGLYRKLETMNTERDRLKAELSALASRETAPGTKDGSEIDQAIEALQRLREAFAEAEPDETKTLLAAVVSKIVLHFDHGETKTGRKTSKFSHGFIHVKPDAGGGWSFGSDDPQLSQLNNTGYTAFRSKPVFVQGTCTP